MNRVAPLLTLAILLLAGLVPSPAHSQAPIGAPWWDPPEVTGPNDFRLGWNLRVPLHVHNDASYALRAGDTATAHLDIGRLASEAGWPSADVGGVTIPRGFTLDLASIRLVQYEPGWTRIVRELPAQVLPTWLEPDQSLRFGRIQTDAFEPTTSATVTLLWRLPATLPPQQTQFYYAYFDAQQNSHKADASYSEPDIERLESQFWMGRSTEFYGVDPGQNARNLEILGIHDDTRVTVYLYPPGLPIPRLDNRPGATNPFTVNANQIVTYSREIGPNPTFYKVVADKPILVNNYSPGPSGGVYIPSTDDGMTGRDFQFRTRSPGIFISAPTTGPDSADITVTGGGPDTGTFRVFSGETRLVTLTQLPGGQADVRIQSTAPILVQSMPAPATDAAPAPPMNLVQAPSELGSPIGRRFFGATSIQSSSGFQVLAHDQPARLQLLDPPRDPSNPIFPASGGIALTNPGLANERFVRSNDLSAMQSFAGRTGPGVTESHIIRSAECDEWPCTGNDPAAPGRMQVLAGSTAHAAGSPLGGRSGLSYEFKGGYVAFARYDNTRLSTLRLDTRPPTYENATLDKDMYHVFSAPAQALTLLSADKPVAVFAWPLPSQAAYTRYAATGAASIRATIGQGELRGYLIGLSSPLGDEPIFVTGRPGETLRIPLEVRNLGRWPGLASFQDAAVLSAEASTPDWPGQVRVEPARVDLQAGQAKPTDLVIEIPPGATGTIPLVVDAASEGNPNMRASFQVIVFVQRSFGVRLWFGDVGTAAGPRTAELRVPPRGQALLDVVLQNMGSAVDSFRVTSDEPGGQWSAQLLRNGQPVDEVLDVPPQGKVALQLRIAAPATEELASVFTQIEAQSRSSDSAADRIVAIARLSFGLALELSVADPAQEIEPGTHASFTARVTNQGKEPVLARLRLVPQLAPKWDAALIGDVDGPLGTEISLFPRQSADFTIRITAPNDAQFRARSSALLLLDAGEEPAQLVNATSIVASVRQTFGITTIPPAPLDALPNSTIQLQAAVRNTGNWFTDLNAITESLPAGWTLTPTTLQVAPGATATWRATLRVPDQAPAGDYDIRIRLDGGKPGDDAIPFKVRVARVHDVTVEPPAPLLVTPEQSVKRTLTLSNHGNGAETLRVQPVAGNAVDLLAVPSLLELAPGKQARVTVYASIPLEAADGIIEPRLSVTSSDGTVSELVPVPLEVARARLVVSAQFAGPSTGHVGDPIFVLARIRNEGRAPASNVTVALLRDNEPIDSIGVARIPPGGDATVTLRSAVVASSAQYSVALDPDRTIAGAPQQTAPVAGVGEALDVEGTPSITFTVACAALLVAFAMRRWRP